MITIVLVGCLCVGALAYFYFFKENGPKLDGKIPPGPRGLPFIGSIHLLDRNHPFLSFYQVAQKYGDVCLFRLGKVNAYIFSDLKTAKELFSVDVAFAGRINPAEGIYDMYETGTFHGVINTEGEHWEQIRRFTLRQLRDFGFGKSSMESLIMEELNEVMQWMKDSVDVTGPAINDRISVSAVNALWRIMSGERWSQDDPRAIGLTRNVTKSMEEAMQKGGLVFFIPSLKYVVPEWCGYNGIRRHIAVFRNMFTNAVEEHKSTYSEDFQRDFIDVFLKEIKSCTDPNSAFFTELGERQLVATIADLFMAGTDTTSTTMEWAFLYLSTFPEAQKKLQDEMDRVVGRSRTCGLADRPNLPYAESVMSEILRFSSIVAPGVPRKCLADRVWKGWAIPKGTALIINIYGIHFNKEIWGDPENFRPERFLSEDGATYKKHEALIPFSTGRRQCAGETLARDSLFLYLTNIFQRFEVAFDPKDKNANPGLAPKNGLVLGAKPFKVVFKDRLA